MRASRNRIFAMARIDSIELHPGRHYIVPLPPGEDLMDAIARFCRQQGLVMAGFRAAGTLASVILGSYDSRQQVFVTHQIEGELDIVGCEGTIRIGPQETVADARILVSDLEGVLAGGRLFSPSAIRRAEAMLTEYRDPVPARFIDPVAGLPVWKAPFSFDTP